MLRPLATTGMGHLTTERKPDDAISRDAATGDHVEDLHSDDELEDNDPRDNDNESGGVASSDDLLTSFFLTDDFLPPEFGAVSEEVARDVVRYIVQHGGTEVRVAPCRTATIMRCLVDDALINRLDFMQDLVLKVITTFLTRYSSFIIRIIIIQHQFVPC